MKRQCKMIAGLGLVLSLTAPTLALATSYAVWLDGNLSSGGNAIYSNLLTLSGGNATLVTTAQLETAGFLNSFDAIAVSRYGANFGGGMSALAAANVKAYVGSGATQGGVALFTNDMADNLQGSGSGDPYDANLQALFVNAATFAAKSHHGYIGEFNGAAMAVDSNANGFSALGLLQGNAGALGYAPQFHYGVGPIGGTNPIDAGVTFPFVDGDTTPFRTVITGADPANIVDVYLDNNSPAVLANAYVVHGGDPNPVPEPSTFALLAIGLGGAGLLRRRAKK